MASMWWRSWSERCHPSSNDPSGSARLQGTAASQRGFCPLQAGRQRVERRLCERGVVERRPDEAALLQATGAQPYVDPVVHAYLERIATPVGEDVGVIRVGGIEIRHHPTQRGVGRAQPNWLGGWRRLGANRRGSRNSVTSAAGYKTSLEGVEA